MAFIMMVEKLQEYFACHIKLDEEMNTAFTWKSLVTGKNVDIIKGLQKPLA
jgi:hypothetical protein